MLLFWSQPGNGLDHAFLPAQRTGLLTPLLTCFTLLFLSPLLGQNIRGPITFLPLLSWTKLFYVQILFPVLYGQNNSQSKFPLLFALPGQKILSLTLNLQK